MTKDALGDRMKNYERAYRHKLVPRSCVFVRVDGKSFHTWTKAIRAERPFDSQLIRAMDESANKVREQIQGCAGWYRQSDEVTFMLTDFRNLVTQGWFGYDLEKIVSVTASMFSTYFNRYVQDLGHPILKDKPPAFFDARAFVVPREDAANVFVWRQKDWIRNCWQMIARYYFSQRELDGLSSADTRWKVISSDAVEYHHKKLHPRIEFGTFWFATDGDGFCPDGYVTGQLDYERLNLLLFPADS